MLSVIIASAWPTMLEQLMQTAVQYIDTAMVGSLGTQAIGAKDFDKARRASGQAVMTVLAVGIIFTLYDRSQYAAFLFVYCPLPHRSVGSGEISLRAG